MKKIHPLCVAIPVLKNEGLASRISRHFGKTPGFLLSDSEGTQWEYLDSNRLRKPGECAPISSLAEKGCQFIFCQNMGPGALQRCRKAGLRVYETQGGRTVSEVLEAFRSGKNTDLPDSALCHHDHGSCIDHSHGGVHEH